MAGIDIIEIGFNQPELWRFKEKNLDQTDKSRGGVHPPFLGMGAHPLYAGPQGPSPLCWAPGALAP